MSPNLEPLFHPRAMAVVGATDQPGRVGRIVFESLLRAGCPVHPVHPRLSTVLGRAVISSVEELPDDVDLVVIATGAEVAVHATAAAARRGIPFVIPVAGGFSEIGEEGARREARLLEAIAGTRTRLLGPNSLGIFVPATRLDTIFVEHGDSALASGGGVAFVSQSGSIATESMGVESNIGFGLRAFVGLGNKADLDEVDFLRHFRDDPGTTTVALYMEALTDGRALLEEAREVSRRKPVVFLKAGRSHTGAAAASSHTGRLSGSDRVVGGALRQYGIVRVFDDEQLMDAARVLSVAPPTRGSRVAIVSPAGGYGVIATDYVESREGQTRLAMARLAPATRERLRGVAPPFASTRNPVDLTGSADDDMTVAALQALLDDDGVDMVLLMSLFAPPGITEGLVDRVAAVVAASPKPVILVAQLGPLTEARLRRYFELGVVGFPSIRRAVAALRWLVERADLLQAIGGAP